MATKRHSTTDIPTDGKCIRYDRETGDYACYLYGEFIGYAANYSAGEQLCNEVYYAQLTPARAEASADATRPLANWIIGLYGVCRIVRTRLMERRRRAA